MVMGPLLYVVERSIDIDAPAARVFEVITRASGWDAWSTMLSFRGGEVAVGREIRLGLRTPSAAYDFTATVTELTQDRAFEWLARTGIPHLFDGRHRFEITPLGADRCRLRNVERYTGLLVPVVRRTAMMRAAPEGFDAMNREIRAWAEAGAR